MKIHFPSLPPGRTLKKKREVSSYEEADPFIGGCFSGSCSLRRWRGTGGLSDCNQPGYDIYIGWYAEDPTNNPEDPTAGYLVSCMPDSNGQFRTEFLFSYSGCSGGTDIGTVTGNRTGNNVSGTWSGTVDGTNIGGNFSGTWDGSKFSGQWDNTSGKVHIQIGSCEYFVAPDGTWALFTTNSAFTTTFPSLSALCGASGVLRELQV